MAIEVMAGIEETARTGHPLSQGSIQFIGTATALIRHAGFTILTDPNFLHQGDHVHLGYGLTSERLTNPAIELEDVPPIDFVLLSHFHGDHFDQDVQARLNRKVPIVTTPEAARKLAGLGFSAVTALPKWASATFTKGEARVRVVAMPGRHGPAIAAFALPEVMGSMLEFQTSRGTHWRMYVSGDTLVYDELRRIPKRYPQIDLALLHLGGTRVLGMLVTMDAKQGVRAVEIVGADLNIPIHYNDYTVFRSPLEDFMRAVEEAGLSARVRYLRHGQTYDFEVPAERLP